MSFNLKVTSILVFISSIGTSLNCSNLTAIVGNNSFCYGSGSFIFLGFFGILSAAVGYWFLISNDALFLIGYFTSSIVVACLSLAGCSIALYLRIQIIPTLKFRMQDSLLYSYGTPLYPQATAAWNQLQEENLCCGVMNGDAEALYANSTWFKLHTIYPLQRVPSSCCLKCSAMIEKFCTTNDLVNDSFTQQRCSSIKKTCEESQMKYINYVACQRRRFSASLTEDDNFLYYKVTLLITIP
uniref:Tetraspanin n=1 Tax=Syphacia muris TaxID=451379 RepID=A0A0N5AEY6_9BILA